MHLRHVSLHRGTVQRTPTKKSCPAVCLTQVTASFLTRWPSKIHQIATRRRRILRRGCKIYKTKKSMRSINWWINTSSMKPKSREGIALPRCLVPALLLRESLAENAKNRKLWGQGKRLITRIVSKNSRQGSLANENNIDFLHFSMNHVIKAITLACWVPWAHTYCHGHAWSLQGYRLDDASLGNPVECKGDWTLGSSELFYLFPFSASGSIIHFWAIAFL